LGWLLESIRHDRNALAMNLRTILSKLPDLRGTTYKTDKRLWALTAAILFVAPWFVPQFDCMRGSYLPAQLPLELFKATHDSRTLAAVGNFALSFGTRAVIYGWVLHCLIVIVRDKVRRRKTSEPPSVATAPAETRSVSPPDL